VHLSFIENNIVLHTLQNALGQLSLIHPVHQNKSNWIIINSILFK